MALQLWDDFEDEFTLFGISSNRLDEVKFIYSINKNFKVKFGRIKDFDIYVDGEVFHHSLYSCDLASEQDSFFIIKNLSHPNQGKGDKNSLFPTMGSQRHILKNHKRFDYLLKIPYHLEAGELNPLPLEQAWFVSNYSQITDLSNKEEKLFFI